MKIIYPLVLLICFIIISCPNDTPIEEDYMREPPIYNIYVSPQYAKVGDWVSVSYTYEHEDEVIENYKEFKAENGREVYGFIYHYYKDNTVDVEAVYEYYDLLKNDGYEEPFHANELAGITGIILGCQLKDESGVKEEEGKKYKQYHPEEDFVYDYYDVKSPDPHNVRYDFDNQIVQFKIPENSVSGLIYFRHAFSDNILYIVDESGDVIY